MNLRDLKYLVAVADLQHFGKAAEACHVSQPTLSMQIKKLEEFLGVTLIERTNRQVMLTAIGRDIAAQAREVVTKAEQIEAFAKQSQDPLAGEFRLGAFPTLAPYLLPLIMPKLAQILPKLTPLLIEEKSATLLAQLKEGKIDAALLALPLEDDTVTVMPLFNEPFDLTVPQGHALASKESVTYDDIVPYSLLLLDEGHCLRDQALELCTRTGAKEAENFRATSLETLRQMVASGVGITLMPRLAAKQAGTYPIVYIPFSGSVPSRRIGFVTRKTSPKAQIIEKLGGLIVRQAGLYLASRRTS